MVKAIIPEEEWQAVEACSGRIAAAKMTIAFAESATAGMAAAAFALTEHSGSILKGGVVCYDACLKEDLLGLPGPFIDEHTPESEEVTRELALRLKKYIPSDISVAITGLTTPGGSETAAKPVGTMFYCVVIGDTVIDRRKVFTGRPEEIIQKTIVQIAKTISQYFLQPAVHGETGS